jgi:hypothetical protein
MVGIAVHMIRFDLYLTFARCTTLTGRIRDCTYCAGIVKQSIIFLEVHFCL